MYMKGKEISAFRKQGKTFQEIADYYGISKQAVHDSYFRYIKRQEGKRGSISHAGVEFNISNIPYDGLYEHFKANEYESVFSFCSKAPDTQLDNMKMRGFLSGAKNSRFTISEIKAMCDIVGKSFEETFRERGECE